MGTSVTPNYIAGGTIAPCRFVTMTPYLTANGTTTPVPDDFVIWQASAGVSGTSKGDTIMGVSQEGTDLWSSSNAATVGEQLRIWGPGEIALVEVGSGGVTAGAIVKSDANGKAILVSQDEDRAAGWALQGGAAGTKVQVFLHPHTYQVS